MTREQALSELKAAQANSDIESAHGDADDVLCDLLRELGYGDVVDAWLQVPKWYA